MKTIGLIGGMSWESTVTYYQVINRMAKETLGGFHSAPCVLWSVDFHEIEACQTRGDWAGSAAILAGAARSLEGAGAEFLVLCTNTMHKVAPEIQAAASIPLLHIADPTADELRRRGVAKAGLLGTRYTMEDTFLVDALAERGIETVVPDEAGRRRMNDIIFNELCLGEIREDSRRYALELVDGLVAAGGGGVILGCTEIGLLLRQEDTACPLFDTALLHARGAALRALA